MRVYALVQPCSIAYSATAGRTLYSGMAMNDTCSNTAVLGQEQIVERMLITCSVLHTQSLLADLCIAALTVKKIGSNTAVLLLKQERTCTHLMLGTANFATAGRMLYSGMVMNKTCSCVTFLFSETIVDNTSSCSCICRCYRRLCETHTLA